MNTKAIRKQLAAAVVMCMVAALALGTSTFAWFVNNGTVEAKGMTVNATADSSLSIKGLDDEAWGSVGTSTVGGTHLKPATSIDGVNFAVLKGVDVEHSGSANASWDAEKTYGDQLETTTKAITKDSAATAEGNYVETTYYLKASGTDAVAYVSAINADDASDLGKAQRVSIAAMQNGAVAYSYVYNPNSGSIVTDEGVGKLAGTAWDLDAPTYVAVGKPAAIDAAGTFALTQNETLTIIVRVWYEGQDTNCYSDNTINVTDKAVSIEFAKWED